jgi:hypothetical protein
MDTQRLFNKKVQPRLQGFNADRRVRVVWCRNKDRIHFAGLDQFGAQKKRPCLHVPFQKLLVGIADSRQAAPRNSPS